MSLSIISFYAVGIIGLVSALVVASSLNPVHRIAFLILVFLSGSFLMVLLDFYFLGLTYIIVYVGAIMILFLFVIMMVQIHLMPVTTSIDPRVLTNLGMSIHTTSAPNSTSSTTSCGDVGIHPDLSNLTLVSMIDANTSMVTPLGHQTLNLTPTMNGEGYSNINRIRKGVFTRLSLPLVGVYFLLVPLFSLFIFTLINPTFWNKLIGTHYSGYSGGNMIVNYFFPSWFIEFKTMTDLETLANILYLGYPTALLLVGVALWAVLIGIIKVTASKA